MVRFTLLAVLVCCLTVKLGAAQSCPVSTVNTQFKTFTAMANTTYVVNPEKGYYMAIEVFASNYEPVAWALEGIPSYPVGLSVVLLEYVLDTFVTSDISSSLLTNIAADFKALRDYPLKSVVRFTYTEQLNNINDAALPQLLRHINQLAPILQANADVILTVQAGFIGAYGEWFYSKNYASTVDQSVSPQQQVDRNIIVGALLNAVPKNRMIQLRTPKYKQKYCNTTSNLPASQAFNPSNPCSRIGIHNDCFMARYFDMGTFESDAQRPWLTNEGLYTIVGGESCEANTNTGCAGGMNAIRAQRFTYLNYDYHPTVINGWKNNKCLIPLGNLMGYRFQLVNGTFPTQVTRGSAYQAQVAISNTGVAPLYNERPVQVVLRNKVTKVTTVFAQSSIDPRFWAPGTTSAVCLNFVVPSTLATGAYDVILNLPDASSSLANKPAARILLVNDGVQELTTRYNILGQENTSNCNDVRATSPFKLLNFQHDATINCQLKFD